MSTLPDGFTFSADRDRMDRDAIHAWLSEEAYWALGRTRATQDAAIDGSLNYGIFDAGLRQVAYARAVTDGAAFAWFCDVFVDSSVRGLGVGKALAAGALAELDALGLERVVLATGTAHGLYSRFGFTALEQPSDWMIKRRPVGRP